MVLGEAMKKGYVRRTSRKDREDAISIPAQIERLKQSGVEDFYIDDGKTASLEDKLIDYELQDNNFFVNYKLSNRPAFKQMLIDAKLGIFNELFVWKWDRFSRNVAFQINIIAFLRKCKVIVAATDDSNEELMRNILSIIGQEESKKTKERINLAKKFKFDNGLYCGSKIKWGYKWKKIMIGNRSYKTMEINPKEAAIVKEILTSKEHYRAICERFKIHPQIYYNLKKDVFYRGYVGYKGQIKKGVHQPIINEPPPQ